MKKITFNELPEAIGNLILKIETLEHWIKSNANNLVYEEESLLTIDQAAKLLHLTKPTIYSKVSRNEIPYLKKSKRLYFLKSELLNHLKTGSNNTPDKINQQIDDFLNSNKKQNV